MSNNVSKFDSLISSGNDFDKDEVEQGRVNAMRSHLFGMMEERTEEAKKKPADTAICAPAVSRNVAGAHSGTILKTDSTSQEAEGE